MAYNLPAEFTMSSFPHTVSKVDGTLVAHNANTLARGEEVATKRDAALKQLQSSQALFAENSTASRPSVFGDVSSSIGKGL